MRIWDTCKWSLWPQGGSKAKLLESLRSAVSKQAPMILNIHQYFMIPLYWNNIFNDILYRLLVMERMLQALVIFHTLHLSSLQYIMNVLIIVLYSFHSNFIQFHSTPGHFFTCFVLMNQLCMMNQLFLFFPTHIKKLCLTHWCVAKNQGHLVEFL